MIAGWAERGIPEYLCIIMSMNVDEAGRHNAPIRVHRLASGIGDVADGDDPAILDADIAAKSRFAAAIDDRAIDDLEVQHLSLHCRPACKGALPHELKPRPPLSPVRPLYAR